MRIKKITLVLTASVLCLTALAYAWPTSCYGGSIKLWNDAHTAPGYPSYWYMNLNHACMDDGYLAGIKYTVLKESSAWSPEGYTWYAGCCAYLN